MTNAIKRLVAQIRQVAEILAIQLADVFRQSRRIRRIKYVEVKSYTDLLSRSKPSILWLYEPQALQISDDLLFSALANKRIRADHVCGGPPPTGVGLTCLSDALISGESLVGTSNSIYQLEPAAPGYIDLILSQDPCSNGPPVGRRTLIRRTRRFVPGLSVLLTHWNAHVYGHWLLECMPRLLLLRRIANQLPACRIVLPLSTASWIVTWIRYVLPNVEIEIYDHSVEYLQCEKLLLPTQLMYWAHYFHPSLNSLLDELCSSSPQKTNQGESLYVSRVEQSQFRELANRAEIEDIAMSEGLTLVRPETLSIPDQIALFANARLLVGEFGSAMHNALFSPAGTKVLCINWINGVQSRIAQLRRHQVGYLLPSDGVPVEYARGAPLRAYHVDPQIFRRCVRTLLDAR
jgi:hypothetical protein